MIRKTSKQLQLKIFIITSLVILSSIVGCRSKQSSAVVSVEEYFQAIIEKNQSFLETKICEDYQMEAMMDFNIFALVETSMENFSCQAIGESGQFVHVECLGSINARFGEETRSFDLSKRTYLVVEQEGNWLVCGHVDDN